MPWINMAKQAVELLTEIRDTMLRMETRLKLIEEKLACR